MLRVTIELFPKGQVSQGEILSQILVTNDGTGNPVLGNYKIEHKDGCQQELKRYPRWKGHLELVSRTLAKIAKYENKAKELRYGEPD